MTASSKGKDSSDVKIAGTISVGASGHDACQEEGGLERVFDEL